MKYATFDANGILNARYDSSIHANIPQGAVELSDELFSRTINESDGVWKLVDGEVVKTALPEPEPYVPNKITMRQARLALHQSGLLSQVETLIASGSDAHKIEWEFAQTVERDHPLVAAIADELSLTEQQLDDLFTLGATL